MSQIDESNELSLTFPIQAKIRFYKARINRVMTIISNNEYFISQKSILFIKTQNIILIVYAKPSFYSKGNTHLPFVEEDNKLELYGQIFLHYLLLEDVAQLLVGHFHDKKGRCYIQLCITTREPIRKKISPGSFKIKTKRHSEFKGIKFIFLRQKPRSEEALSSFINNNNLHATLLINSSANQSEEKQIAYDISSIIQPKDTSFVNSNTIANIKEIFTEEENKVEKNKEMSTKSMSISIINTTNSFQWNNTHSFFSKYPLLKKWFDFYCTFQGLRKRKCLLLYSDIPGNSKMKFATGLVNDNENNYLIMHCLDKETYIRHLDKPLKILIIDGITIKTINERKEIWERIITGQKYYNKYDMSDFFWEYKLPCIIITTDIQLLKWFIQDPFFSRYMIFQEIQEETINNDIHISSIENNFSVSLRNDILSYLYRPPLINH